MLFQSENRRAIGGFVRADPFEDAQAVVQRVGQDVDLGVTPRHHFAIQPNHSITVGHRHREFSLSIRALKRGAYYTAQRPCRADFCLRPQSPPYPTAI